MSVHLVGGGRDTALTAHVFQPFVAEAMQEARDEPAVIALLLVLEPDDETSVSRFSGALVAAGAPADAVRVVAIVEGDTFAPSAVHGAHGIMVGGGLTPAYLDAMTPIAQHVRYAVAIGVPYLGFSAGAAIAPANALVGGYRIEGVTVSPEDAAEELDELTVRSGLGIVDFVVDVHAAQWGTVGRLIAAVEGGLVERGVAIDEHTALAGPEVHGAGRIWRVQSSIHGAEVTIQRP
jgi:cyanophycinase